MPKYSLEYLSSIPNFSLNMDLGGTVVNRVEGLIQTTYEAYTSKGAVSFSHYRKEGLKVIGHDNGIGAMYDSSGFLTEVKVDVRKFLNSLIDDPHNDNEDLGNFIELSGGLEVYKGDLVAYVDLETGKYCLMDMKTETKGAFVTGGQKDGFEVPGMILTKIKEEEFVLTFQMFNDEFVVGIGLMEEAGNEDDEDEEISPIGNLLGCGKIEDEEKYDFQASMMVGFVANHCDYLAYFECVKGDRFEKLARKIFSD